MNVSGLLTSAGVNITLCTVLSLLYSVLRKQPGNVTVYFGQRLSQIQSKGCDPSFFERIVPSASWIIKAWRTSEEDLFVIGGLDAVVFFRIVIFSIRIFFLASVICISVVLPLNYFGHAMHHKQIRSESLEVFTIGNVQDGSRWFWVHCLALYIISCCGCALLYIESRYIAKMRSAYISGSPSKLSRFTVLVRAIPWSGESYSDSVTKYFSKYYATSYVSHQMVYYTGTVKKLVNDAEKMYNMLKSPELSLHRGSDLVRCGLCGETEKSFKILSKESELVKGRTALNDGLKGEKECAAALVFFRTRYAALVAAQTLQHPHPMLWVTDLAPEPSDVYWSNLCIPYRLLWVRRIGIILAFIVFMIFFLVPVSFVQGLVHLDKLKKNFSFVRKLSSKNQRNFIFDMVTGYLPSAMLMLFLCIAPPIMIAFSAIEGPIARSLRKKSACLKVLYFLIWNVFFANILSGSVLERFDRFTSLKEIPSQLANGVPSMAVFFMTYVLTSGWTSLAIELMQPIILLCHWLDKCIFRGRGILCCVPMTFPYHTELPRVLLFGLLGFTSSITAPLMLPFLMVYFFLAYLVYRNQFINVYVTKYDTGGLYWPIAHNAIIFSMTLMQLIALGVFGAKKSTIASSFTIPLIICTQIFNLYCRKRFFPIFKNTPAQVIMEMDMQDEHSGKLEEYHDQFRSAYCQFKSTSEDSFICVQSDKCESIGRQLEEVNEHMRSGYCSFKSTAHNSPLAGHLDLDQRENGDEYKHQDTEDIKEVKRSNRSPKGEHPHVEIEEFINVYVTKYDTGGLYWPIAHNAIIFSMTLMQLIALGVFGAKKSTIASSFTIPLIICTQIFNLYCRKRFFPIFKNTPAQVIMEMDMQDEHSGKLEEYHDQFRSAYCQFKSTSEDSFICVQSDKCESIGRQLEEVNEHMRSGYCSFKSTAHNSPLAGHLDLDQRENGDEYKHQDTEDIKEVKRSNRSPKGEHPHVEIEEVKLDIK